MTSSTAWPENVIARYETAARGHVDVTAHITETDKCTGNEYSGACRFWETHPATEIAIITTCTGVGCTDPTGPTDPYGRFDTCAQNAARDIARYRIPFDVRRWAQSHAEKCRALPNPNA